ncbi:MAG: nickel-binding protein [Nitrososphaerales archaeon]
MPKYMDTHKNVKGITAKAAADAHKKDLDVQGKYGVNYLKYWVDEKNGNIFCLVVAPNSETAAIVHREAHGLVADEIVEITEGS